MPALSPPSGSSLPAAAEQAPGWGSRAERGGGKAALPPQSAPGTGHPLQQESGGKETEKERKEEENERMKGWEGGREGKKEGGGERKREIPVSGLL